MTNRKVDELKMAATKLCVCDKTGCMDVRRLAEVCMLTPKSFHTQCEPAVQEVMNIDRIRYNDEGLVKLSVELLPYLDMNDICGLEDFLTL